MIHKRCELCGKSIKEVGKLLKKDGMLLCKSCREKIKKRSFIKKLTSKPKTKRFG